MVTVIDIAEKLNVSRDVAYGFVRFCEATKILRPVGKLLTGERGKPAYQYEITDDELSMLAGLLTSLVTPAQATVQVEVETPVQSFAEDTAVEEVTVSVTL